ncbi:four helix bundle protein [Snuella sedimenti]|nr:four helix bundle protein [Snuella sedimenti]
MYIALGSLSEVETQVEIAARLNYIDETEDIINVFILMNVSLRTVIQNGH